MVSIAVKTFGVCDFSRLALAALALVVFGAYDSYPLKRFVEAIIVHWEKNDGYIQHEPVYGRACTLKTTKTWINLFFENLAQFALENSGPWFENP